MWSPVITLAGHAVKDGMIDAVGPNLTVSADQTLDASGLLILPGIIDVHTHPVYLDDLNARSVTPHMAA